MKDAINARPFYIWKCFDISNVLESCIYFSFEKLTFVAVNQDSVIGKKIDAPNLDPNSNNCHISLKKNKFF